MVAKFLDTMGCDDVVCQLCSELLERRVLHDVNPLSYFLFPPVKVAVPRCGRGEACKLSPLFSFSRFRA